VSAPTGAKVLVENLAHVMVLTLNRPEARNAVDGEVCDLIGGAIEHANKDVQVRAIVLTGAGDLSFCAGADLKALARGDRVMAEGDNAAWGFAGFAHHVTDKPTIAAVNGSALGGGLELALACDLVVAEEHAVFGLPEVKRGLFAGGGGAFRVMQQMAPKVALQMLLTGDSIGAQEAARWGLVNEVVPRGQSRQAAVALATRIAENAPLAVQASKRVALGIIDGTRPAEAAGWAQTDDENVAILKTEDAWEGARAFAEKRAPVWQAR
jgi:crotonobetainyl-CoA hydratase